MSQPASSLHTARSSTLAADLRAVFRKLKQRLREQGGQDDLTPSQVAVILRLEKDGATTVSGLAREEGMRPQSMSAVVTPLQEAGLVKGAPDPSDGRQTLMSLTPKCRRRLEEGRTARQDWLATTIAQKLSVREQKQLEEALELLTRLAEK